MPDQGVGSEFCSGQGFNMPVKEQHVGPTVVARCNSLTSDCIFILINVPGRFFNYPVDRVAYQKFFGGAF